MRLRRITTEAVCPGEALFTLSVSPNFFPHYSLGFEKQIIFMADSSVQPETIAQEQRGARLKYLDFVQVALLQAVACLSGLYFFAKDNAGPLKPGVQSVERMVKAVVSPIYDKFHDLPLKILKYVDRKVEQVVCEVEPCVPFMLKKVSIEAYTAAQRAAEVAQSAAEEVRRSGLGPTVMRFVRAAKEKSGPVVCEFYGRYEPAVERYVVAAWRTLNRLPVFPHLAHIIVPTVVYWLHKYNDAVGYAAERGYVVSEFLPLVPTGKIAKVFDGECCAPAASAAPLPENNDAGATDSE